MSDAPADLWLTRQQAAVLCGLSARQFDDAIRPRLPAGGERGTGQKLRISGPAVVAALVAYRVEQAKPAPTDDDPLLAAGGDSPNLERYRLAKAQLAERDLAERDRTLVRRQVIIDALRPAATGMRAAGDRLIKAFGNEAGQIFNEAVDDFEAAVTQTITRFGADDDNRADGGTDARRRAGRADAGASPADAQ